MPHSSTLSIGKLHESVHTARVADAETDYLRAAAKAILSSVEVCLSCHRVLAEHEESHRYQPARLVAVA